MGVNLTTFLNRAQTRVAKLLADTGATGQALAAQTWYKDLYTNQTPQPADVNLWFASQITGPTITVPTPVPGVPIGSDAEAWLDDLETTVTGFAQGPSDPTWPPGTRKAWTWFQDNPVGGTFTGDGPADVIDWVIPRLPLVVVMPVMVQPGLGGAATARN